MPPPGSDTGGVELRAQRRARAARERGLHAGGTGHPAAAARHMRSGLRWLGWSDADGLDDAPSVPQVHHAVAARLLISLAFLEAEQGRTGYGLRLLDLAEEIAAAEDRGVVLAQRGLLFIRTWRGDDALKMLDEAVPLLDGRAATAGDLARALLNRGFLHLNTGR